MDIDHAACTKMMYPVRFRGAFAREVVNQYADIRVGAVQDEGGPHVALLWSSRRHPRACRAPRVGAGDNAWVGIIIRYESLNSYEE
jgi:hypothetical protein